MKKKTDRREFLGSVAAVGAAAMSSRVVSGQGVPQTPAPAQPAVPRLINKAPDGKVIRAGLIGCGGRGGNVYSGTGGEPSLPGCSIEETMYGVTRLPPFASAA